MDSSSLTLLLKILGAPATFFGIWKVLSDLVVNRLVQRKHMAEMVGALTTRPEEGKPEPHPMLVQAQFQAAFGGEAWRIPSGKDLRHFLANHALATMQTARSLTASLSLVTYSESADGFTPAEPWTAKKLDREYLYQHIAYWVVALLTLICFATSDSIPSIRGLLLGFAAIGLLYAIAKAYRAGQINRARRLLKLTAKPTPSALEAETPEQTNPAHPSTIAPGKAPGTLAEPGASVPQPDPSKP